MNNHEKKTSNLWTFKMSKQIYYFRTMHQVWNNNVKLVMNIKLTYLPGLQKRTSMDGCNISLVPSSHLTKTLDEILWCSEPQNFLLKCICSISCKTNHKKHSIFKSTLLSVTLTFTCLLPVLCLLMLWFPVIKFHWNILKHHSDHVASNKLRGINRAYELGKIFHTSWPFTVTLFTWLNSQLVSQLIGNMSLDNYILHFRYTVEGPVVINTSVNATNISRQ